MGEIRFNSHYLGTDRGICKIIQIIAGIALCSILCGNWYGGQACFAEGRLGYVSGLNFVLLLINVVVFFINLCNIRIARLEYFYNVIASILLFIATVLLLWYMIQFGDWRVWRIITLVGIVVLLMHYLWDSNRAKNSHLDEGHLPI
jgi:K+ transporter